MNNYNKYESYTLSGFIQEYATEDLRIEALHFQKLIDDPIFKRKIIINEDGIFNKYMNELEENKNIVTFNTSEYYKYRFNPKLLSFDVYGTTELWSIILMLNEIYTITEFDLHSVILLDTSAIRKFIRMSELEEELREINLMEIRQSVGAANM